MANAQDDGGDPIRYTFTAQRGSETPLIVGPQAGNSAAFDFGPGDWKISVYVDDLSPCPDAAADATCTAHRHVCSSSGDTHCLGLQVVGPEGGAPGIYEATATATNDSGEAVISTFAAQRGDEAPIVVGPRAEATASFDLGAGAWTITVEVDDDPTCPETLADARCSTAVEVREPGGSMIPGDANGDRGLDISDAVAVLGSLFLGGAPLPCGDGSISDPANLTLLDWQPDGGIDISDAVSLLTFLFIGGQPHALAVPGEAMTGCVRIVGCRDLCGG
jgi:hypothetical protein